MENHLNPALLNTVFRNLLFENSTSLLICKNMVMFLSGPSYNVICYKSNIRPLKLFRQWKWIVTWFWVSCDVAYRRWKGLHGVEYGACAASNRASRTAVAAAPVVIYAAPGLAPQGTNFSHKFLFSGNS